MNYQEFQPTAELAKYIKCIWILELESIPPNLTVKDKILPDGCIELIFHYGDHYRRYKDDQSEIQHRSFVYGQLQQFIEIGPTGKTGIIAVRFFPYGARPFLHIPINELTNQAISTDTIFGKKGKELEDKIMTARNTNERIMILEKFLIAQLRAYAPSDFLTEECVNILIASRGKIKVEAVAKNFNMSSRHLERKFISAVGMSPKMLARIIRFQNTLKIIQSNRINSLTALAYENGYYDQAHFIRDFKDFSGVNPSSYLAEGHPLGEHFIHKD